MICEICKKENRNSARFCLFCGSLLRDDQSSKNDVLHSLVGLDHIKHYLEQVARSFSNASRRHIRLNYNTLIIGNTGTGKTMLGKIVLDTFFNIGIIPSYKMSVINFSDPEQFLVDWTIQLREGKGGILLVEDADNIFLKEKEEIQIEIIRRLSEDISKWGNDPIIILTGTPSFLEVVSDNYPLLFGKFNHILDLHDYSAEELTNICISKLEKNHFMSVTGNAREKLFSLFKDLTSCQKGDCGNAHLAEEMAQKIYNIKYLHSGWHDKIVIPADIPQQIEKPRSIEEIFSELDNFEGMKNIKGELANIVDWVYKRIKEDGQIATGLRNNFIVTGNPGVGKNTISRVVSEIFRSIGILTSGQVIRVEREDLVAENAEKSIERTNIIINNSLGGILYINNADRLIKDSSLDDYGIEVIKTLTERLDRDNGRFICFLSGEAKKIEFFLNLNPTLRERFPNHLHIIDLKGYEMAQLFRKMAANDGVRISEEADMILESYFDKVNMSGRYAFQNMIAVRSIYSTIFERFNKRVNYLKKVTSIDADNEFLTKEDIIKYD